MLSAVPYLNSKLTGGRLMTGVIFKVVDDKGYGFIRPVGFKGRENDVFFHVSALPEDWDFDGNLVNKRVDFELTVTKEGKRRAESIRLAEDGK